MKALDGKKNSISGCTTPDDKYLPGAFATPPTMSWRSAQTWNLEACGVYFGAKDDVIQDIADEGCYSFGWRLL